MSDLAENLQAIKTQLNTSKLIAVSKTKPTSMVKEVYECGQLDFGENKVQDLLEKSSELQHLENIRWHFIGQLQSNKINQLLKVPHLFSIHSIDRLSLLEKLLKKDCSQSIGLFLQVNTSDEKEKAGFTELDQLKTATQMILSSQKFKLQGLMTIGKIRTDEFEKDARSCFLRLKQLKEDLDNEYSLNLELSMGMSSDFLIAQELGANWVRIGSSIFGNRA